MAEKPFPFSQMNKPSVSDCFILAHARRNADPLVIHDKHSISQSIGQPPKSQNHPCLQGAGTKRNYNPLYHSAASQRRVHHPLNMIVSETATRKSSKENNFEPFKELDSNIIRNSKFLQPLWKEKEVRKKQLQYAHLHNKRKIEEIQFMKAKLKCPRYDPDELLQKCRCRDQESSSESNYSPKTDTSPVKRYPLYGNTLGPPHSEGSLHNDFFRDNQVPRWSLSDAENSPINSTPNFPTTGDKFVWNPVILPDSNSFSSVKQLLDYHYNHDKDNDKKEWFNSPGRHTTSSLSSGLTVEEETVKLTYYARSGGLPDEHSQRRRANQRFLYNPLEHFVEEWYPNKHPEIDNYFEE